VSDRANERASEQASERAIVIVTQLFSKVSCRILQFLHQMFNVSVLLLDDALLKCVVTEVILLSIVAFKTLTFHKVV